MNRYLVIVMGILATSYAQTQEETQCSKYHYEQQILSKQIRMDIRLETLENKFASIGLSEVRKACDDRWIGFQSWCYLFGTITVDFEAAERFCNMYDSHLVSIRSSTENDFIKSQVVEFIADKFWIGMTDDYVEGSWRWIDRNDEVQFYNWGTGEPNQGRDANCGSIWHHFGDNYVDVPCTGRQYRPICKKGMA